MKSNLLFFVLSIFLLLIFVQYVSSVSYSDFTTSRTCSQTWGGDCNSTTLNDSFDNPSPCNGTQYCLGACGEEVEEVYLNASAVRPNEEINATCQFYEPDEMGDNVYEYIFYYNGSGWVEVYSITANPVAAASVNRSVVFHVNSSEGEHIVRCSIQFLSAVVSDEYCVKNTGQDHDNDDVNFTVVTPLEYDFWNLTNYTTGGNITSGQTYNRSDVINVSAHWTKGLNYSVIEHNGTGTLTNYTISSFTGNWVNYTLNLSNTTEFNVYNITITAIYANDSTGVWGFNKTSPTLYFYLSAGNPPNVTNFWFNQSTKATNTTNLYTNLTIYVNVSDDVGLSTVIANITYPDGNSTNVTMTDSTSTGWQTWNYTFGDDNLPLNITGNYTVRVYARDIGGQEKASGVDYDLENMTFYVNNTYTLNLTPSYSNSNTTYNRGEAIIVDVLDVNDFSVQTLNWTVNVTRFNQSQVLEFNQSNATYLFQPNSTDPVGNYTLYANVSKDNNTGNQTWQFNISNTLNLNFSQPTVNTQYGTNGIIETPIVNVYNVRNETLNYPVNVTLQCPNGYFNLTPSGQQYSNSSAVCRASTSAGVTFQITTNTSDVYNNSGEFDLDLITQSSGDDSTSGGGGGMAGSSGNVTIINVTSNVTDFNFTLSTSEIQIYRGEDKTIVGALSNTGDTNLTLTSSIFLNSTCCIISINPSEFILEIGGAEVPFTISIHVNTTTQPDTEHFADLTLKSGTLEKSKRIKIIVKENPVISSLDQVTGQISEVESKIREYVKAGIDVGALQNLLNQIKGKKSDSTTAFSEDDINRLKQYDDFIQSSLQQINDELNKLAFLKLIYENKYNIVTGIAIGLVSTYLVTQIVLPYFKIDFEIRKLILERASLTKSRVVTTKSFFLRKIDEKTFRSIITDRQGKIYKLKSMIELKKQAKSNLLRERLNPLYAGKLIREKFSKMKSKKKQK